MPQRHGRAPRPQSRVELKAPGSTSHKTFLFPTDLHHGTAGRKEEKQVPTGPDTNGVEIMVMRLRDSESKSIQKPLSLV